MRSIVRSVIAWITVCRTVIRIILLEHELQQSPEEGHSIAYANNATLPPRCRRAHHRIRPFSLTVQLSNNDGT